MKRLRILECLQLLGPGLAGLVTAAPIAAFRDPRAAVYLAALFLHLLFTYTYNDYAERDRDLANVRKTSVAPSERIALGWISLGAFVGCLGAIAFLPFRLQVLFVLFQAAGILYSHPRTLWKGRVPLSELLHLFTGAGYFLSGHWLFDLRTGPPAYWGGLAFAAIYLSGSCLGQVRDLDADRMAGLRTLAIVAGRRTTLGLAVTLQAAGLLALAALAGSAGSRPAALLVAVLLVAHIAGVAAAARTGRPFESQPGFQRRYRVIFGIAVASVVLAAIVAPAGRIDPAVRIDAAIDAGLRYLARGQNADGSWPYFRSPRADFGEASEFPARAFVTMHVLMTLHDTPAATREWVVRARRYLLDEMEEGAFWSVDGRSHTMNVMVGSEPCWFEPDIETTVLGNLLFADDLNLTRDDAGHLRDHLERYRFPSGLYGTYLHEFYGERGCPAYDNLDAVSLGSNLHVLAWLEANGLDATRLVRGLGQEMQADRYWERAVYYRSLPILAHLASNAVEHGARSAIPFLERLLDDHARHGSPAADLNVADLAALINARSHLCRLGGGDCAALQGAVHELFGRQAKDGGWPAAPIYVVEITRDDFERSIYPRVRDAMLARSGRAPTLEQALAGATLGTAHHGSPAESTALAVKALINYRRVARFGDPE